MSFANQIHIEQRVQAAGDKCAEYATLNGEESPDLMIEYGRALFDSAKASASLLEQENVDKKEMVLENPKVKIAGDDFEDASENEEEQSSGQNEDSVRNEGQDEEADANADDNEEANEGLEDDDFVNAFQIVDLARVLLSKQPETKERDEKIITCRLLLGDISLEDDNPPQAIEDYTEALNLTAKIFGIESKQYVQTAFMLSLAFESVDKLTEAKDVISKAVSSAKAIKSELANDLELKLKDLETELGVGSNKEEATQVTKESISGRTAVQNAVENIVSQANDISQFARKKRKVNK
ncbi:hypothetical protein FF38_13397 [Lucilia cuprina]|uniref:Tetratricopeptide SHNi-TPR domain-containing protein n=1 Tax=Lucilia cuprina TaxID=7375 RepID=A0A0L0CJ35_LUCCU|nr:hypothetical protein FF38_13397 [Lucilia cuprina]